MTFVEPEFVGVIDWSLQLFHGFATPDGSSYNAWLLQGPEPILIDSVKVGFWQEFQERLERRCPISKIQYLICLHAEPDHSGCIQFVWQENKNIKIVCSSLCVDFLKRLYPVLEGATFIPVTELQKMKVGALNFQFKMTPMQHWPESMCAILEDKYVFSSDFFGQHLACTERWADQFDIQRVELRQIEYAANIMCPMLGVVRKTAEYFKTRPGLEKVFTAHGVGFRGENVQRAIELYRTAGLRLEQKVTILYASMYGNTASAAEVVGKSLQRVGLQTCLLNVQLFTNSRIALEMFDSRGVVVCTPTLNGMCMPQIECVLRYLQGLNHLKNKKAFIIGSHCWTPLGVNHTQQILEQAGAEVLLSFDWELRLSEEEEKQLIEQSEKFGSLVKGQ